ncbi:MAG: class I SAM-dependent methyltransferase [Longimicrobiaceae bacterium]
MAVDATRAEGTPLETAPGPLRRVLSAAAWRLLWMAGGPRAVFTRVYRRNVWGNAESVSGPGSTESRGADFRDELIGLLRRLDARVLLDAPCGDFNWIGPVADAVPRYVGVDVVPELVERVRAAHGSERRTFACADLARDPLPRADVILCRDGLVHFSFREIRAALRNFRRSGATHLLATTFVDTARNVDIRTGGGWRALNLQAPPFAFPPPLELVDERCTSYGGRYRGKRLGLWRIDALPE